MSTQTARTPVRDLAARAAARRAAARPVARNRGTDWRRIGPRPAARGRCARRAGSGSRWRRRLASLAVGVWLGRRSLAPATAPVAGTVPAVATGEPAVLKAAFVSDPRYLQQRDALIRGGGCAAEAAAARRRRRRSARASRRSASRCRTSRPRSGRDPANALLQELLVNTYQDEMRVLTRRARGRRRWQGDLMSRIHSTARRRGCSRVPPRRSHAEDFEQRVPAERARRRAKSPTSRASWRSSGWDRPEVEVKGAARSDNIQRGGHQRRRSHRVRVVLPRHSDDDGEARTADPRAARQRARGFDRERGRQRARRDRRAAREDGERQREDGCRPRTTSK